jgi:hypothetical protein
MRALLEDGSAGRACYPMGLTQPVANTRQELRLDDSPQDLAGQTTLRRPTRAERTGLSR